MTTTNTNGIPDNEDFWFPGRWVGGITLIVAPLLILTGVLLRIQFHFFFPQQLEAYDEHPDLVAASYRIFLLGNILLFPGVLTLCRLIGRKKPVWAVWGGVFVILGLFARTFHAGVDHLAFQLVRVQSFELANKAVGDSYGAFNIVSAFTGTILFGWIILAIGAYLSGTLGLVRSMALALMSALMIGVLKGSSITSVVATSGLCIALVPLGIKVLNDGPKPGYKSVAVWALIVIAVITALYFLGQAG
jgi:hypothetical protein